MFRYLRRFVSFMVMPLFILGLQSCTPQSSPETVQGKAKQPTRITSASAPPSASRTSQHNRSEPQTPLPQSPLDPLPMGTPLPDGTQSYIRIFKREAMLEYWVRRPDDVRYVLFERFPICAFSGDLGPKLKEGDRQSPEGFYRVRKGSLNPNSSYHLSFNLGFPNAYDRAHGRTGSYLMVHGNCVSIGCYAMTDGGIETIYGLVEAALGGGANAGGQPGQAYVPVHIFPFKMTDAAMNAQAGHKWITFWENLKQAYDAFEKSGQPPVIVHRNKRYEIAG